MIHLSCVRTSLFTDCIAFVSPTNSKHNCHHASLEVHVLRTCDCFVAVVIQIATGSIQAYWLIRDVTYTTLLGSVHQAREKNVLTRDIQASKLQKENILQTFLPTGGNSWPAKSQEHNASINIYKRTLNLNLFHRMITSMLSPLRRLAALHY